MTKDLKVKFGTETEVFWTDLKKKIEADILNAKRQIEVNEYIVKLTLAKIADEKRKV